MHLHQLRRQYRADRARIDAAIRVAAGLLIHGAGVLARAAADALERLACLLVGEDLGARVVHQDDMEATRTVAGLVVDPCTDRVVGVHALARPPWRKQLTD